MQARPEALRREQAGERGPQPGPAPRIRRQTAIVRTGCGRLGLSRAAFAAGFHVPVGTLRDWEQNRRLPDAPALAYLRVIAWEPAAVPRAPEGR
jgi:putative transcriptional regulator